jgi:hypothetical protein
VKAVEIALAGLLAFASPAGASPPFQLALDDGSGWAAPGVLDNRPSVLLFWDSRCPPCLVELANVAALQKQFPEAVFVTVSLSPRDEGRRILARMKLPETIVQARAPSNPRGLLATLGNPAGALPFAAAFDPSGQQCAQVSGALSTDQIAVLRHRCRSRSDGKGTKP